MGEIDWELVITTIHELIDEVQITLNTLCEAKFYDGCSMMDAKIYPLLRQLLLTAMDKAVAAGIEIPEEEFELVRREIRR